MLKALPGFALIELPKKYESGIITDKEKYAIRSEGTLIDYILVGDQYNQYALEELAEIYESSKGKTVYFAAYQDGEVVKHENKEYVFVPLKELRGAEQDAEA